jgi:hypothetical protein
VKRWQKTAVLGGLFSAQSLTRAPGPNLFEKQINAKLPIISGFGKAILAAPCLDSLSCSRYRLNGVFVDPLPPVAVALIGDAYQMHHAFIDPVKGERNSSVK